jgi:hypothetical protein
VYSYQPGTEEERSVTLSGRHQIAKINQSLGVPGSAMVKSAEEAWFRAGIAAYLGV